MTQPSKSSADLYSAYPPGTEFSLAELYPDEVNGVFPDDTLDDVAQGSSFQPLTDLYDEFSFYRNVLSLDPLDLIEAGVLLPEDLSASPNFSGDATDLDLSDEQQESSVVISDF